MFAGVTIGEESQQYVPPQVLTLSQMHPPRGNLDALSQTRAAGCVTVSTASMCEHPARSVVVRDTSHRRCFFAYPRGIHCSRSINSVEGLLGRGAAEPSPQPPGSFDPAAMKVRSSDRKSTGLDRDSSSISVGWLANSRPR